MRARTVSGRSSEEGQVGRAGRPRVTDPAPAWAFVHVRTALSRSCSAASSSRSSAGASCCCCCGTAACVSGRRGRDAQPVCVCSMPPPRPNTLRVPTRPTPAPVGTHRARLGRRQRRHNLARHFPQHRVHRLVGLLLDVLAPQSRVQRLGGHLLDEAGLLHLWRGLRPSRGGARAWAFIEAAPRSSRSVQRGRGAVSRAALPLCHDTSSTPR